MNTRRSLTVYSLNKIGYSIILIGRPVPSTRYSMLDLTLRNQWGPLIVEYPASVFDISGWLLLFSLAFGRHKLISNSAVAMKVHLME